MQQGQVAVAPSLHPSGVFYEWVTEEGVTADPKGVCIKEITVSDVAVILDAYHKTGKINVSTFKLPEFEGFIASLLGLEDEYKSRLSYASPALINFNTKVSDKQVASLLNVLQKIWPEPGAGRWAASCGISALLGVMGVPKETAKYIIKTLAETKAPGDRWNDDLLKYVERTYRELEDYKVQAEQAKKLGQPIPKLPVAYKAIMRLNTPFTDEELDEVRREVEQILGVSFAERLGLKKASKRNDNDESTQIYQKYLLDDELQVGTPSIEKTTITTHNGDEIPVQKIRIPIIHHRDGTIKASTKIVILPDNELGETDDFEPVYLYNVGNPLIVKPVKIEKLAYLDEDVYARLNVAGVIIEGPIETVMAELQRMGLLAPNKGTWVKAYLTFLAKKEDGEYFTTLGINKTTNGKFVWVGPDHERYYPLHPSAGNLARKLKKYIQNSSKELYDHFIKAIVDYRNYVNEEAYWFAMSYLFVGPFLPSASRVFKLSPILYLYHPVAGSGKSALAKFVVQVGHGIKPFDKDVLGSNFRSLDLFSSISAPIMFDEVDKLSSEVLSLIVAAVTGAGASMRGRGIATLKEYEPVVAAVITSNTDAAKLSPEPRWLDRIVQLKVEAKYSKAVEYLTKIEEPFAFSASKDADRVTVAHFFLPELVDMVNDLGGEAWLRERFKKWFQWGAEHGLSQRRWGRIVHKFATFMVGLELMARFLKRKGAQVDVSEGARVIYEHFKEEVSEIPRPVKNFILALATTKDKDGNLLIDTTEHEYKGQIGYLITAPILSTILDDPRHKEKALPTSLSELAEFVASIGKYGTKKDIYRTFAVGEG